MTDRSIGARQRFVLALAVALIGATACDDSGTSARRALAERFVERSADERGGQGAFGPERDALLAGHDWDLGLLAAARQRGGLRWEAKVTYEARGPEGRTATLTVGARLDLRSDGSFRARLEQRYTTPDGRSGETGREALWLDRLLYTRIANGPFFVRQSFEHEHESWRAAPVEAVGELVRVLRPLLEVGPGRGDDAAHYELRAAAAPPVPPADPAEQRRQRERDDTWPQWLAGLYRAERATGELTLAKGGRSVERVRLTFAGAARDAGAAVELSVSAAADVQPLSDAEARWSPPEGARTPLRDRTHARVDRILAPFREPAPADAAP